VTQILCLYWTTPFGNDLIIELSHIQIVNVSVNVQQDFVHGSPLKLVRRILLSHFMERPHKTSSTPFNKYANKNYIQNLAMNFPNTAKWIENTDIDNVTSNQFWKNPNITEAQIEQVLKFRTNQYMANARKQLFFRNIRFPKINCTLCTLTEVDTWKHVLLTCTEHTYTCST